MQASTLTGRAGNAVLNGSNQIGTLGGFTTISGFSLSNAQPLTVTGPVTDGSTGLAFNISGALTLQGSLGGPAVTLNANGIRQSSGSLVAGSRTATSGGDILLTQPGNAIAALNSVNASGTLSVSDGTSVAASGLVANNVALNVAGNLVFGPGMVNQIGTLVLDATGQISEAAGNAPLDVTTLTGLSGGATALTGPNLIPNLGSFGSRGGFALSTFSPLAIGAASTVTDTAAISVTASGALSLSGSLSAPSVQLAGTSLNLGGAVSAGAVQLSPSLQGVTFSGSLTANTLAIAGPSGGAASAVQTGGTLSAGTLNASGLNSVQLGGTGTALIGTLGSVSLAGSGSTLSLANAQPLTVAGPLTAQTISVSAPGLLTLQGGQISGGAATLSVTGSGAQLRQTGVTSVASGALALDLPGSGGAVTLTDLTAGNSAVTLNLGSGSASGSLTAGSLAVNGSGGSATLTGTVAGQVGGSAATISTIAPAVSAAYTFNGCVIATACTTVAPPVTLELLAIPQLFPKSFATSLLGNVLQPNLFTIDLITVGIARDPTDPELVLPNISDRDY